MFILGLLAFLQTTFIPGFIALKFLGDNHLPFPTNSPGSKIRQCVYSFGLSLLINYLLVFIFTSLGIYKPLSLFLLLFIEAGLLLYYWAFPRLQSSHEHSHQDTKKKVEVKVEVEEAVPSGQYINAYGDIRDKKFTGHRPPATGHLDFPHLLSSIKGFLSDRSFTYKLFLLFSVGIILWHVFLFLYFLGGVFEHWDPVVGWNRFALDWANNHFPTNTWRYPQLIPSNWSISYVLMQNTEVQCFASAIMPLFSLAVLLLFLDLALQKNKTAYLLGLISYGTILAYLYNPSYIASGYVDIAVSFFGFLAFHALYISRQEDGCRPYPAFLWATIFAAAAAVTKQAGLFFLAVFLVWGLLGLAQNHRILSRIRDRNTPDPSSPNTPPPITKLSPRKTIALVLAMLLIVMIIAASWYMLKENQIRSGQDRSEIALLQKFHNAPVSQRLLLALENLTTLRLPKLKIPVLAFMLIILLGLFRKESRPVTFFIVIPYSLMWGIFYYYDFRNLAPAVPFMAFSAAFGAAWLKKILPQPGKLSSLKIPIILVIASVMVLVVLLNFTVFKEESLLQQQTLRKMKIGDTELNDLLYRFYEKEGLSGKIATDYQYLNYLPGLQRFYWYKGGRVTMNFLELLETPEGKEIHYFLLPKILETETQVLHYYREKIKTGAFRLIFKWRGYIFVKVK